MTLYQNSCYDACPKFLQDSLAKAESLMITGGKTVGRLYETWGPFRNILPSNIYMSDERCVSIDDQESNYGTILRRFGWLAKNIVPINGDAAAPWLSANQYEQAMPRKFDLILLSMGGDGHVASLFPGWSGGDNSRMIHITDAPIGPKARITISNIVIAQSKELVLLVSGRERGTLLRKFITEGANTSEAPVMLTRGAAWMFDAEAAYGFGIPNERIEPFWTITHE